MTAPEPNISGAMTPLGITINLLSLIGLIVVSAYVTIRTFSTIGIVLFSWHPSLMSIGVRMQSFFIVYKLKINLYFKYLILMAQGILAMADYNFVTKSLTYQKRVTVHWVLQVIALVFITIGQTTIYIRKAGQGKSHFTTLHGIIGLITYLLTVAASLGGVFTLYSFQLRAFMKPITIKIIHSLVGILTYLMGVATIGTGIFSKSWVRRVENDSWVLPMMMMIMICTTPYVLCKSVILLKTRFLSAFNAS